MAFGLCNAPATFERLMKKILRDLLNDICLIYLDEASLKLNRTKCTFFQREVEYLEHIVSENGKKTDPKKIEAIVTWPIPSCKK